MTKEPIMIDDIDVAECEFYKEKTHNCSFDDIYFRNCLGRNCHYKLYKREEKSRDDIIALLHKEREEHHTLLCEYSNEVTKRNVQLKILEQINKQCSEENEELKQALQEIKEIANKNEVCPYDFSHHCYKYDCKRKKHCEIAQILQKCEVIKDE